jgi:hypothetical protein
LLIDSHSSRTALLAYWANILLLGAVLFFGAGGYATRAGLVKGDIPPDVPAAICRRILSAQSLYAFGAVPVRGQHVLEHQVCRARATQLCDRFRSGEEEMSCEEMLLVPCKC